MATLLNSKEIEMPQAVLPPIEIIPKYIPYEEFLEIPEQEGMIAEWVQGEVIYMSVGLTHKRVSHFLLRVVSEYVERNQLGEVFYEPFQMKTGLDLPGRSPDIFFVANKNLTRVHENYLEGPADLVVEVISPESVGRDRGAKYVEYEIGGVGEYWLINPIRCASDFYQRGDDGYFRPVLPDKRDIYFSRELSGFWFKPEWLWQNPFPTLESISQQWKKRKNQI